MSFALIAGATVAPAALASAGGASAAAWLPVQSVPLVASDLGFDAQGNAIAVGVGTDGVRTMSRPFGGSWTSGLPVTVAGDSAVSAPRIAVDSDGDAVAVWSARNADAVRVVRSSRRSAGGAWSVPTRLTVGPAKDGTDSYAVVLDDQGEATVTWIETVDGTYTVRALRAPLDSDWSTAARTTLSDGISGEHADALQLAGAPGGRVVAAWIQRAGGFATLKSRRVVTGSWTDVPDTLDTAAILSDPRIATNDHGDATAVWTKTSGGVQDVRSSRRTAIGGWTFAYDVAPGREPDLTVDSHGTATVAWGTGSAGTETIRVSSRPGGSSVWAAAQTLATSSTSGNVGNPRVAADPERSVTAIWSRNLAGSFTAEASRRSVTGDWSSPIDLLLGGLMFDANSRPVGGLDPQGNATLLWSGSPGSGSGSILDAVAPELRNLTVPSTGIVGRPVQVSVEPFDLTAVTTTWSFDGVTATGAAASHTFSTPGLHTITVTGEDAAGNTAEASSQITILPLDVKGPPHRPDPPTPNDPKPGPTRAVQAPALSGLRQTSTRWTLRKRRGSRVPVGTSFRFHLDRSAQVRLSFEQLVTGRRSGKRCVKATKKNRAKRACTRTEKRGTLTVKGKAGANGVEFRGKVGGRTLKPGRYQVRVTATADGKTSKAATKTFTIVR